MLNRLIALVVFVVAIVTVCVPCVAQEPAAAVVAIPIEKPALSKPVDFAADVLPILRKNCTACHQGDEAEASLVLDDPQAIVKGGDSGPAVDLKAPEQSLLIRLAAKQEKPFMPPTRNKVDAAPLTPQELGTLLLWVEQGAKGETRRLPPTPQFQATPAGWGPAYAVAISPDSRFIAFGRGNRLSLYDLATDKTTALNDPQLQGVADPDAVHSLAFSPDGLRLAMGGFRAVRIWKQATAERRYTVAQALAPAPAANLVSPDQMRLAMVQADTVKVVELNEGGAIRESSLNVPAQRSLQHAADDLAYAQREMKLHTDWVAAATAIFTDLNNQLTQAKTVHQAAEQDLAGKQAAAQAAGGELVLAQQAVAAAMQGVTEAEAALTAAVQALAAAQQAAPPAPDVVSQAQTAMQAAEQLVVQSKTAFDETTKKAAENEQKKTTAEQAVPPAMVANQAAEQKVTQLTQPLASQQQNLDMANKAVADTQPFVDAATSRHQKASESISRPKFAGGLVFSKDMSRLLVGQNDGSVQALPLRGDAPPVTIRLHDTPVVALSLSADGQLVSIASDGQARAGSYQPTWELERVIVPAESQGSPVDRVLSLAFSPDGQWLAGGGGVPSREGELVVWKVEDGSVVRQYDLPHSDTLFDLAFWRDGHRLATAAADKFAKVFSPHDGSRLRAFEGHTGHVTSLSWNHSGRTLVTSGADRTVKVWHFHESKQLKTIEGFDKQVVRVRHLGHRPQFAAAWGDKVQVMDEEGNRAHTFDAAGDPLHSLTVSPDGYLIVAGGQSGKVYVWESNTGKLLAVLTP